MRTTLNVDEELLRRLRSEAERTKTPFESIVNQVLRMGLERLRPAEAGPAYECPVFAMGLPPEVDLDKALALAAKLDEDEVLQKFTGSK